MVHRIRVTLIIPDGDGLLFVREGIDGLAASGVGPYDETFWQLPGGGLEPGESIYECAVREAREETGLEVEPLRVVYLQEIINPDDSFSMISIFVLVSVAGGVPTVPEDDHVLEVRSLTADEASHEKLVSWSDFPDIWADLEDGFPIFRHLGVQLRTRGDLKRRSARREAAGL